MNMGTAMKAVGTGWKQSGTTDNGKGRDAGKADFADTFSEMLKAGKKASEWRKQTQNTQKAAEAQKITDAQRITDAQKITDAQADQKAADTGKDAVKAETSGQDNTAVKKTPEKKQEPEKADDRTVQDEAAAAAAALEGMAEQPAVMAEDPVEAMEHGMEAEAGGLLAVTEAGGILDQTASTTETGAGQRTGNAEVRQAAANTGTSEALKNQEALYQTAAQKPGETGSGRKTEAMEPAAAETQVTADDMAVQTKNSTGRDEGTFSDLLKDQSDQMKAMGAGKRVQTEDETDGDEALDNQMLEELKKNSDGKGVTYLDKISASRQGGFRGVPAVDNTASDIHTPVAEQLKAGVEQGMKRELSEFTIKLKPEGLGEIIVHMASANGRTSVSIGVSNPESEKLVNSQMTSLKEMLQPLHAEVEEVYHNSQGGMDFAGFGQELYQNQGQQARGHYHHGMNQGMTADDGVFAQETERMAAESLVRRLYAYV